VLGCVGVVGLLGFLTKTNNGGKEINGLQLVFNFKEDPDQGAKEDGESTLGTFLLFGLSWLCSIEIKGEPPEKRRKFKIIHLVSDQEGKRRGGRGRA